MSLSYFLSCPSCPSLFEFSVDARTVEIKAQETGQTGALVEARGLRFAYAEDAPEVVRGVSLAVERGRLSALVGANGSGKSTLARRSRSAYSSTSLRRRWTSSTGPDSSDTCAACATSKA